MTTYYCSHCGKESSYQGHSQVLDGTFVWMCTGTPEPMGHPGLPHEPVSVAVVRKPLHHYVIVRDDLPLGVLGSMIIHAAGESAAAWAHVNQRKLPADTHAVLLEVSNEAELLEFHKNLVQAGYLRGVDQFLIDENSGPYAGQFMAIGILPRIRNKRFRSLFKDLRPLGGGIT